MEKEALIFVKELPESCSCCAFWYDEFACCSAFSAIYGDGRYPEEDEKDDDGYYCDGEFYKCMDNEKIKTTNGKWVSLPRFSKCPLRLMSELEGKINVDN